MKALAWIVGIVLLLVLAAGTYVFLNSGSLLERAIETLGPRYLGAPVSVDGVDLSLTEGAGEIRGLRVGNPSGYSGPDAFALNQIALALDLEESSADTIVVRTMVVDGAEVTAIARGQNTNLKQLLDNVSAATGDSEATESAETGGMKLIIDSFAFTNASASVRSDILGSRDLELPELRLTGIGRQSNGVTAAEALRQILAPLYRRISEQIVAEGIDLEGMRDELEGNLKDKAQEALGSGLKGLTDRLQGDGG